MKRPISIEVRKLVNIDHHLCDGCGQCVTACPFNALTMVNGLPKVGTGCTGCMACEAACPTGAIGISDALSSIEGPVMVWGQVDRDGRLSQASIGLASVACELASVMRVKSTMVITTERMLHMGLENVPANKVLVLRCDHLTPMMMEGHVQAMELAVRDAAPSILLISATPEGRELAPRLAARLEVGLTADCTALDVDDLGILQQTRPAFGGELMATIVSSTQPQMATVRPGAIISDVSLPPPVIESRDLELPRGQVIWIDGSKLKETSDLAGAEVVIAVGRGVGNVGNMVIFERLAYLMGASLACSRPLADAGWMQRGCQVGQSGITIAPRAYIAFGISGSLQHRVGMNSSDIVVAINLDPEAPIMQMADIRVVADAVDVASKVISMLEQQAGLSHVIDEDALKK